MRAAVFYVTDTKIPGHVYELSNEHHLFNEIKAGPCGKLGFQCTQTEEEAATSPEAVSLEIDNSRNITIANYHGYRVTRSHATFPAAVRVYNSSDIHFRNVHVNAESGFLPPATKMAAVLFCAPADFLTKMPSRT